jgi:hypothetical protein
LGGGWEEKYEDRFGLGLAGTVLVEMDERTMLMAVVNAVVVYSLVVIVVLNAVFVGWMMRRMRKAT